MKPKTKKEARKVRRSQREAKERIRHAAPDLLVALLDLTALYAATPGHDPCFVKKGQAAIAKALRGRADASVMNQGGGEKWN